MNVARPNRIIRSGNREFASPRTDISHSRKLLVLETHLSKSNTLDIDDSRRHCRPIFAPTDKPSDNCVAIPILNLAANFIFSFAIVKPTVNRKKTRLYPKQNNNLRNITSEKKNEIKYRANWIAKKFQRFESQIIVKRNL